MIYADFESLLEENTTGKNIEIKHLHKACSYMFNVVSDFDEYKFEPKIFRGENAIQNFLDEILKTKDEIMKIIHGYKPMIISKSEQKEYEKSNICHICEKQINTTLNDVKSDPDYRRATSVCGNTKFSVEQVYKKYNIKVRDHCHITGKYIGPAHYDCNLNRNYNKFKIPVFFHNGKGYDAHFIIQEVSKIDAIEQIDIIPKNEEKYITYGFNNLKFVDSISFMNPDDSLDKLVKSLRNGDAYDP